jgi:hypothetical protein
VKRNVLIRLGIPGVAGPQVAFGDAMSVMDLDTGLRLRRIRAIHVHAVAGHVISAEIVLMATELKIATEIPAELKLQCAVCGTICSAVATNAAGAGITEAANDVDSDGGDHAARRTGESQDDLTPRTAAPPSISTVPAAEPPQEAA